MKLPKQAIQEYQEIYKRQFGEEITEVEAEKQGRNLLELMQLMYKPIPNEAFVDNNKELKS